MGCRRLLIGVVLRSAAPTNSGNALHTTRPGADSDFPTFSGDLLNSLLNQFAKAHRVTADEVDAFEAAVTEYNPNFDYEAILSKWCDAFGDDAVTPILYRKGADAVLAFCDAIGVTAPPAYARAKNPNPALSAHAFRELRAEKAAVTDEALLPTLVDELHRRFAPAMIDTFDHEGPALLGRDTRRQIACLYERSNSAVREKWFPSRTALF